MRCLGDCLPACPVGAISFIEREAAAYDEAAVLENKKKKSSGRSSGTHGRMSGNTYAPDKPQKSGGRPDRRKRIQCSADFFPVKQLPVQIKLAPVKAPYFDQAKLLIAADCTAYAYGNFHQEFIKNKVTLIGCPKLDEGDYSEKLTQIIANNDIKSVTIVRMEVPCCGGLENAAKKAIQDSGKFLPWQVHTISIDGKILEA